ncbi:hypothetical protein [Hazenella coriacea]|uniref:Uncharacterized protein n=1 Tax=Hazenella coriacea TaxID=1179467 RepID=A0A4R3LAI7_9BACL|nr:hypothetical protein [Hazenella coriacea]TCS96759.1 hypothetical protein EDD58_101400 [Hazenella coriacea]
MIINRRAIAREKIEMLKNGYSTFADSEEVAQLIKKQISELNMVVHIDQTPQGCWFIPKSKS